MLELRGNTLRRLTHSYRLERVLREIHCRLERQCTEIRRADKGRRLVQHNPVSPVLILGLMDVWIYRAKIALQDVRLPGPVHLGHLPPKHVWAL